MYVYKNNVGSRKSDIKFPPIAAANVPAAPPPAANTSVTLPRIVPHPPSTKNPRGHKNYSVYAEDIEKIQRCYRVYAAKKDLQHRKIWCWVEHERKRKDQLELEERERMRQELKHRMMQHRLVATKVGGELLTSLEEQNATDIRVLVREEKGRRDSLITLEDAQWDVMLDKLSRQAPPEPRPPPLQLEGRTPHLRLLTGSGSGAEGSPLVRALASTGGPLPTTNCTPSPPPDRASVSPPSRPTPPPSMHSKAPPKARKPTPPSSDSKTNPHTRSQAAIIQYPLSPPSPTDQLGYLQLLVAADSSNAPGITVLQQTLGRSQFVDGVCKLKRPLLMMEEQQARLSLRAAWINEYLLFCQTTETNHYQSVSKWQEAAFEQLMAKFHNEEPFSGVMYDEDELEEAVDDLLRDEAEERAEVGATEKAERIGYAQMQAMEIPASPKLKQIDRPVSPPPGNSDIGSGAVQDDGTDTWHALQSAEAIAWQDCSEGSPLFTPTQENTFSDDEELEELLDDLFREEGTIRDTNRKEEKQERLGLAQMVSMEQNAIEEQLISSTRSVNNNTSKQVENSRVSLKQEEAATVIQRNYRGFRTRRKMTPKIKCRKVQKRLTTIPPEELELVRNEAATKIQRIYRGFSTRKYRIPHLKERRAKDWTSTKPQEMEEIPEHLSEDEMEERLDELLREEAEARAHMAADTKQELTSVAQLEVMERPAETVPENMQQEHDIKVAVIPGSIIDASILQAAPADRRDDIIEEVDDEDMDWAAGPRKSTLTVEVDEYGEMVESVHLGGDTSTIGTIGSPRSISRVLMNGPPSEESNDWEAQLAEDEEWEEIVDDIEREESEDRSTVVNQEKLMRTGFKQKDVQDREFIALMAEEDMQAEFEENRDDIFREEGEERTELNKQEKLERGALKQQSIQESQLMTLVAVSEEREMQRRKSIQELMPLPSGLQLQMARTPAQSFASLNAVLKHTGGDEAHLALDQSLKRKLDEAEHSNATWINFDDFELDEELVDDIIRDEAEDRDFITTKQKQDHLNMKQDEVGERQSLLQGFQPTKKRQARISFAEPPQREDSGVADSQSESESLVNPFLNESDYSEGGVSKHISFGNVTVQSPPTSPPSTQAIAAIPAIEMEEKVVSRILTAPPAVEAPPPIHHSASLQNSPRNWEVEEHRRAEERVRASQELLHHTYEVISDELHQRSDIQHDESVARTQCRDVVASRQLNEATHKVALSQLEAEETAHRELVNIEEYTTSTHLTKWCTANLRLLHANAQLQAAQSDVRHEICVWEEDVRSQIHRYFLDTQHIIIETQLALSEVQQAECDSREGILQAEEMEQELLVSYYNNEVMAARSHLLSQRFGSVEQTMRSSLMESEQLAFKQLQLTERRHRRALLTFVRQVKQLLEEENIVRQRLTSKMLTQLNDNWLYRPSPKFLTHEARLEADEDYLRNQIQKAQYSERWKIMHHCSLMLIQLVEQNDRHRLSKLQHLDWKGLVYEYKHDTALHPPTPPSKN